ncbi:OstA-like protein [Flavobacterium lacus]|uniref:OstA-like protein n=1 Tax=Flavobacterium lacus TaxID=1353778 RepID=A0A328WLX4_9FLAO|nr:OstA-like protein [Flavobacterium lacus]RAR47270.1 OstA-like protein [Flavobacterium lacus]
MRTILFIVFCLISFQQSWGQKSKEIFVEYSEFFDVDEDLYPDAVLLTGNVRVSHDGAVLFCNKAYLFKKENYIKAFGDVRMIQGDTITMTSTYAEYNGENKQAYASGNVIMSSPSSTLKTEVLNFDRNAQQAFYKTGGTVTDKENTLISQAGTYVIQQKMYQFRNAVTITNPKYVIKTNHLDYYENVSHAYLFGPSTITSEANYIYTEKGFYDTKKNFSHFVKNSYIKYNNRLIEGDSLYYDRNREFASATRNVKVTDSINNSIVKGHYGEVYREKDSLMMTKRAVAMTLVEKDTLYIHGKKLIVTGKPENRVVRAFNKVRFFKIDMSGKCDSLHSDEKTGLTKLMKNPVMWNFDNQMTGDLMHLISNKETEKLDSLKVLNNTFIASKDTIGTGYNQVKGLNLYGKFRDNKLYEVDVVKNTEVIYYMRNENQELIGINKSKSSSINMTLDGNQINTITFFKQVEGEIYPEEELPENARKLRGFIWRGDERIKTKDDIFPPEENEYDEQMKKDKEVEDTLELVPMEVRKETLEGQETEKDS